MINFFINKEQINKNKDFRFKKLKIDQQTE